MDTLLTKVNEVIDLVDSSFDSETQRSLREHSIISQHSGSEQLYEKLVILEQYLANKYTNAEGLIHIVGNKIAVEAVVRPLLEIIAEDFSGLDVLSGQRAKAYRAQYESCICLQLLPYDNLPNLKREIIKELDALVLRTNEESLVEVANSVSLYLETH